MGLANASRVETAAVTGVHRVGSSLNLHVHFQTLAAGGVYVEDASGMVRFVKEPPRLVHKVEDFRHVLSQTRSRRGELRDRCGNDAPRTSRS